MTAAPYVNVVALMIGARGRDDVRDFYAHHVVSHIPPAMETVPVSRTIGQGRVVDALIGRFTDAIRMDWLLPGIAPTGTRVEVSFVAIRPCECDKRPQPPMRDVARSPGDWRRLAPAAVTVFRHLSNISVTVRPRGPSNRPLTTGLRPCMAACRARLGDGAGPGSEDGTGYARVLPGRLRCPGTDTACSLVRSRHTRLGAQFPRPLLLPAPERLRRAA
jgi:hypothetical protein